MEDMVMVRYSVWATAAALVVWLAAADTANAQRRGIFGGGRGYGGGYSGAYYGGYQPYWGYGPGSYSYGMGYGYASPYAPGYSSPYGYGFSPYSPGYGPTYLGTGYPGYGPNGLTYGPGVSGYQSSYYTPATDNRARIRVRLPEANATLTIDGDATQQTGSDREFITPPLEQGKTFTYTLKARWMQGNEPVEKTQKVEVRANQVSQAEFTR
jgi:uncharacterized protein (TIGR03000 family)